jgi:hypothetical protein
MQLLREGMLWSAMELFEEGLREGELPQAVRTVLGASVVATSGYVLLNGRVGYWLISALMSRPLWKGFDPLEVIFAWEQEQEEQRKHLPRPRFRSRRRERDEESLQSLVATSRGDALEIEEVAR